MKIIIEYKTFGAFNVIQYCSQANNECISMFQNDNFVK